MPSAEPGWIQRLARGRVWRSIFRGEPPGTARGNAQAVFQNLWLHFLPVKVRPHTLRFTYTFYLGGIAFLLFLVLAATGVALMFYYVPSVERAYHSIKDLQFVVSFGPLLRNLHRWSAHAMVVVVVLHMARVYYTASYKAPREFNWVVGVMLLLLTLGFSFTGMLLPWDQAGFWAATVGTGIVGCLPVVGKEVRLLLLGGDSVGQNALLRFYVLHCMALPLAMASLTATHFWRIRKDGGLSLPPSQESMASEERVP
ncbi:MAG: cytochrome b N-terminal domain-containing protein [Armatimonadetes bacterium]|nr:cytochrome b N-terminal domain-containing protein [Armatimonadota bacterium]